MTATVEGAQNRVWSIAFWVVQITLAVAYAPAGWFKMTMPLPELGTMMAWAADIPELLVRFIGAAEIAAAIGLVLPAATRILPGLSPLAAAGLVLIQLSAIVFHVSRAEFVSLPFNALLLLAAAFVAWGRWRKAPIAPR